MDRRMDRRTSNGHQGQALANLSVRFKAGSGVRGNVSQLILQEDIMIATRLTTEAKPPPCHPSPGSTSRPSPDRGRTWCTASRDNVPPRSHAPGGGGNAGQAPTAPEAGGEATGAAAGYVVLDHRGGTLDLGGRTGSCRLRGACRGEPGHHEAEATAHPSANLRATSAQVPSTLREYNPPSRSMNHHISAPSSPSCWTTSSTDLRA